MLKLAVRGYTGRGKCSIVVLCAQCTLHAIDAKQFLYFVQGIRNPPYRGFPDDSQVDGVILVNEHVAKCGELSPGNIWLYLPRCCRNPLCGFAENFKVPYHGLLFRAIVQEQIMVWPDKLKDTP